MVILAKIGQRVWNKTRRIAIMALESNKKDEFGKYKTLFIPWKPATTFFRILTRCCLSCLFRIQKMVRRRNRMPCVNGGRTVNHDNNFVCRCKDGYTGRLCEQRFFQNLLASN
ncbi:unnamed protein product, partial [Oikopleura dioica]